MRPSRFAVLGGLVAAALCLLGNPVPAQAALPPEMAVIASFPAPSLDLCVKAVAIDATTIESVLGKSEAAPRVTKHVGSRTASPLTSTAFRAVACAACAAKEHLHMEPTVGRIVHYVLAEADNTRNPGEHRAAIVTRTWGGDCVQLQVFMDGTNDADRFGDDNGLMWVTSVSHDEDTKAPRTWHWPERESA